MGCRKDSHAEQPRGAAARGVVVSAGSQQTEASTKGPEIGAQQARRSTSGGKLPDLLDGGRGRSASGLPSESTWCRKGLRPQA